jgi:rsbT co-antagonist protein RsbR
MDTGAGFVVDCEDMGQIVWEARLLRGAPFAVVAFDAAQKIVAWNAAAGQMFGASESEALGAAVTERIAGSTEAFWRTLLAEGTGRLVIDRRVIEWTAVPEHDANGQLAAAMCYGHDVSARVALEAAAKLEGTMLRAILENLDIVVWAMEEDGRCTYQQGKGLAAVGLPQHGFVGKNIREMYAAQGSNPFDRVFAGNLDFVEAEAHGSVFQNWLIPMRGASGSVELLVALSLNVTEQRRGEQALRDKLVETEAQQRTIRELSTPIIEVWDRVLTLPILGMVDAERAAEIMDNLLQAITAKRARFAILDMTGVKEIDTATASHLLGLVRAIRLLGAEGVVTGIHANIAQTIVDLGVELPSLIVHATLRQGLGYCITRLGRG